MIGPLVSIIMPCYNAEAFLEYALMSISGQSYRNYEVVAVDDGSTDQTSTIIEKFQKKLHISLIKQPRNLGLPKALNAGIKAAAGSFIARFDSDDFMLSYRLFDQISFLIENPDVAMVGGGCKLFGITNGEHFQRHHSHEIRDEFLLNNPFIHPTIMFRRELLEKGDLYYREDLPNEEDYELWSRLIPKYQCMNLNYSLIKYRIHNDNAQRNPGKKAAKKFAIRNFLRHYDQNNEILAEALSEFQCSGFITKDGFEAMREYVMKANSKNLPRLAWLHNWLTKEKNYKTFMEYL